MDDLARRFDTVRERSFPARKFSEKWPNGLRPTPPASRS